jgi:molybdate transport system regulatory protein
MERNGRQARDQSKTGYCIRGRIWVEGVEGTFLGYGRVVLLQRIRQYGSITEAAKSMQMSYRHAWELVASMNRQSGVPLVESSTGGKAGGGTRLTEAGEKATEAFWALHKRFEEFLMQEDKRTAF